MAGVTDMIKSEVSRPIRPANQGSLKVASRSACAIDASVP
jgi:hypothetical protein